MLDFDFAKLLVIFVLALVVLGPEKLPRVAAQVGRWIGRARGMARQFREQLEEEVTLEEQRKARPPTAAKPPEPAAPVATPPSASPMATSEAAPAAEPEPEQQVTYPDHYSHAHPTDSEGRPLPAVTPAAESHVPEPAAVPTNSVQQDWVGGVTAAEKPPQIAAEAAYAPPHERGT